MKAKSLLIVLELLLGLYVHANVHANVHADFESASAAYRAQDYGTAFQAFHELADAGDARAQSVIAIMYKYGEGIATDLPTAYHWYLKAATRGYPPAQYNVGVMLADGLGIEQNSAQALVWLLKAADAGYERARDKIAALDGASYASPDGTPVALLQPPEPIAWSKSWNFRLPNNLRFDEEATAPATLKVHRVQLGAMISLPSAEKLWAQIRDHNKIILEPYRPIYRELVTGERTVYRVQIGPFDSQRAATDLCETLKARTGRGCLVVLTD
jgi:TPR repeat protein